MPITYDFTCPNGHNFQAVAKLRARCPTCGSGTRRNFSESATKLISKVISPKVETQKDTESGSKPDLTSTKEKLLDTRKKSISPKSEQLSKPSPRIIRQGMMPRNTTHGQRVGVKKTDAPPATKTVAPTRRVTARVGSHPQVSKLPTGSRERKTVKALAEISDQPFWLKVKKKYFR